MTIGLSISLVVYNLDRKLLGETLHSLNIAVSHAQQLIPLSHCFLTVVDNSKGKNSHEVKSLLNDYWTTDFTLLNAGKNLGYGLGHNMAIEARCDDFHLVINPDVIVDKQAIVEAIRYLQKTPTVGMITPATCKPNGEKEYLCKDYPSVFILMMRGFAPQFLRNLFKKKLAKYELQGITESDVCDNIVISSGCFMFFNRSALQSVKGFCANFFLYFEDFDLALRLNQSSKIAYLPNVKIIHYGGNTANKGLRHVFLFVRSAIIFFNRHGWRFW